MIDLRSIEDLSGFKITSNEKVLFVCRECGKEEQIRFASFKKRNKRLCTSCRIKQTNLEKYGVEYVSQSDEIKNRIKQTNLEKYGVEYVSQSDEIKNRIKQTNLEKYGVEYYFQSENKKEKTKQTNLEKYGFESHNNSETVKKKKEKSYLERYGVKNPSQSKEVRNKIEETNLKKYGTRYLLEESWFHGEIRKNVLNKYKVDHVSKDLKIKKKIIESRADNFYDSLVSGNRLNGVVTPLFKKEDIYYHKKYDKFLWECNKCKTQFHDYFSNGKIPKCPTCYPNKRSYDEQEIYNLLQTMSIEKIYQNSKTIIPPFEIDVYLPDYKLAIEYNGCYWHSEEFLKSNYHQNKVKLCHQQGIRLLHVWEDDWLNQPEKVENTILYYLDNLWEEIKPREPILEERMGFKIWN